MYCLVTMLQCAVFELQTWSWVVMTRGIPCKASHESLTQLQKSAEILGEQREEFLPTTCQ